MADSGQQAQRVGGADREAAERELARHTNEGRLTEEERVERTEAVRAAVTRGDLDAVFADLPDPQAPPYRQPADAPSGLADATPGARRADAPDAGASVPPGGQPVVRSPRLANRVLAVSGSVALILFLFCGLALDGWGWAWLFFLVPGILRTWVAANEPGAGRGRDRHRGGS